MPLFLLNQSFSLLSDKITLADRRRIVCGGDDPAAAQTGVKVGPWSPLSRRDFVAKFRLGDPAWSRVVLLSDAGLGKTTSMEYLRYELDDRDSKRLPYLLRLDQESDLVDRLAREKSDGALLESLVDDMTADQAMKARLRLHMTRMRAAGRITLLVDGLDHAWSRGRLGERIGTLLEREWHACPIVLSGRPWAFREMWPLVSGSEWRFVRVNPIGDSDVRFYLSHRLDGPDAPPESRRDWLGSMVPEARNLLATPRLLFLISEMLYGTVEAAHQAGQDPLEAVKALKIHSKAEAYYRAYFEPGEVISAESQTPDDHDRLNRRGLIAQGLDVSVLIEGVGRKYLGLDINDRPSPDNHAERLRFVGGLLGAIAFEMYANADAYRSKTKERNPEPFATRIPEGKIAALRGDVEERLVAAKLWPGGNLRNDFTLLGEMNNGTVDFLLFQEMAEDKGIVWHDKTVETFFAAHFLTNYGTEGDRALASTWIVDREGKGLAAYDEFWQFAAEMPEIDEVGWKAVFGRCYAPSDEVRKATPNAKAVHAWVQWHRRMIYFSLRLLTERFTDPKDDVVENWRKPFFDLACGTAAQKRFHRELIADDSPNCCFRPCPPDNQTKPVRYMMGSPESEADRFGDERLREVEVRPFRLHEFPVTNEQYEVFDPGHAGERWYGKHPAGNAAGKHPVVNVTFWDAWSFAAWTGNRLPTEEEWEFACRAGTPTAYWFGAEMDGTKCNHEMKWKGGNTNAKGEMTSENPWELWDMHGNVWEWCDSLSAPGASDRVLRGGGWGNGARSCRSAFRDRDVPGNRGHDCGFRLAAVPELEPSSSESSKSVGDEAAQSGAVTEAEPE